MWKKNQAGKWYLRKYNTQNTSLKNVGIRNKNSGGGLKIENYLKIGTWNVRGTFEEGELMNLINEIKINSFDVAIQGTKEHTFYKLEIIYFFNSDSNRILETGLIINKKFKNSIVEFKPVTDRLCYIILRGKYKKITINMHVPTKEANIEDKEDFYSKLDR